MTAQLPSKGKCPKCGESYTPSPVHACFGQLPSKERDILAELRRYHAEIVACDGAECEAMRLTRWAIEEIERLSRNLDTCGLECSSTLKSLVAENEELRQDAARDAGTRAPILAENEHYKREAAEANQLLNSEWFQRVTYKQQMRAAQELLRRCVAPLKVAIVDAESYDCVLDHDVWARLLDEIEAHIGPAQPPGDGETFAVDTCDGQIVDGRCGKCGQPE
jgi:hypothetical protein